jgi:hypothetical protein
VKGNFHFSTAVFSLPTEKTAVEKTVLKTSPPWRHGGAESAIMALTRFILSYKQSM